MKINPLSNPNISPNYRVNKIQRPVNETIAPTTDKVTFSDEALSLAKTINTLKSDFDMRSADELNRIAELTEKIRSGKYKIDSEAVAEKIIKNTVIAPE